MPQVLWQEGLTAWLILTGTILAIFHTGWHYIRSGDPVRSKSLRTAMLLRMVVLILLGVGAFQPRLMLPGRSDHPGSSVHLLIDDSVSMSVVDQNRSMASLVRIGERIGFIELSPVERPLRRVIDRLNDLNHELTQLRSVWGRLAESKTRGTIDAGLQSKSRELLASIRFQTDSLIETVRSDPSLRFIEPKLRQVREYLDSPRRDQPEKLIESLRVDLVRQDMRVEEQMVQLDPLLSSRIDQLADRSRFDLARLASLSLFRNRHSNSRVTLSTFRAEITPEQLMKIRPDLGQTDLPGHLRRSMEKLQRNKADALICLTDGRLTESDRSVPSVLSSAGIPVFFVLCAPRETAPGIKLISIDAPETALSGEQIVVSVRIISERVVGRSVKVRLTDGTKEWVQSVTLSGESHSVNFVVSLSGTDQVHLQAEVQMDSGDKAQTRHSAETTVRINPKKVRVLLLSEKSSDEIRYIRDILIRTPWIIAKEQSLVGRGVSDYSSLEWFEHDLIILAGVGPQSLSNHQKQAIFRYIVEYSKPVLVMGLTPDLLRQYAFDPLLNLCVPQFPEDQPVWRSSFGTGGFHPIPTSSVVEMEVFRTSDSFEDSLRQWLSLPPLSRVIRITNLKPRVRVLLADRETSAPILTESVAGSGRVLTLLIDETWRWQRSDSAVSSERFWHLVVRHLVEPDYTGDENGLAVKVDKQKVRPGEEVRLWIRSNVDPTSEPVVQVRSKDSIWEQVQLRSLSPSSGRWMVTWVPSQAGNYELMVQQGEKKLANDVSVELDPKLEYADSKPDLNLLQRIAASNGGEVFDLEELDRVEKAVLEKNQSQPIAVAYDVWCSPYWFGLMVSCLGLEWVIRKRSGLA
ncbi:MAG: hypothetical protein KatS3mg104_2256 [Phycisphaerae bacterium]|nr:MAG: hypothetical protein KatS3mg104_2256 [Phycisphaerae bacterium]